MNPKIKICGITNIEDARNIASLGVEYLGFIIDVASSPRSNALDDVSSIILELKKEFLKIKVVGVFVDKPLNYILDAISLCKLDVVQLHGNESVEYCRELKEKTSTEIWKACIVKKNEDLNAILKYRAVADKILCDSGSGSGKTIDFELLQNVDVDILAGGLGAENMLDAIKTVHPRIVDVNSGAEFAPGKKNIEFVKRILSVVNNSNSSNL